MYTEIEQQTLDIDWFFTDNDEIAFVASAGGKLPETIAELGDGNGLLSSYFRNLPNMSEVIINPQLENMVQNVDEKYLSDFINMSKKGLYSFDKTVLNNFSDCSYHLVTKPITPLILTDLSANILDIILKTKSNKKLKFIKSLSISEVF
ncbi:hypothetical protein D1631_08430 [Chryseobacterium nematophagum]|uniref:Uncharacterized protein n=1 Tax=Chryseobacterium nematophagum TaxID=2305228 RepID=A0A3M7TF87_9FLAO|nr:hypothetical protein [Chryseobacterium nematophagum]RNA61958.1 hypothetical protein D1631_08430 [Chryseobacterium nematophagum]